MIDLPFVTFEDRTQLPAVAGVYIVVDDVVALYVGKARDLRQRWWRHHRAAQMLPNYRIYWTETPEDALLQVESHFIGKFQPRWNGTKAEKSRELLDQLPPHSRKQVAALTLDLDLDPRDVVTRAIDDLWRREIENERDVFAELDELKQRLDAL